MALVGIVGFLVAVSVFGRDKVPLLGEPPHMVIVKSGGELIGQLTLTNRAWAHLPVGKFHRVEDADRHSVTYKGNGELTVEIESKAGHSIKLVAEEIEFLW